MRLPWNTQYFSVSESDISDDSDHAEKRGFLGGSKVPGTQSRKGCSVLLVTALNIVLFATSVAILVASRSQSSGMNALLKASSFYSPVLDRIEIPTMVKNMNATLFPGPNPSIARQMPNPEADVLWDEIELTRTIVINGEDIRKLGKNPATAARFENDYWGFGDDAYMGQIDVFHQMHCLNELRKLIYPSYYNRTMKQPELRIIHYNHCVDILFQNLACNANTDITTMVWMDTQGHPFPDFSINKQCRDFDTLLNWRKENGVDIQKWIDMKKPSKEKINEVPAPAQYYEMLKKTGKLNWEGHEHEGH